MSRTSKTAQAIGLVVVLVVLSALRVSAQSRVQFVGLGDSIGEGVQSADASEATQGYSFLNLLAGRMGAPFPLPLIRTNLFGVIGSTNGRERLDPTVRSLNLAVSGADVHSILYDAATASDVSQIDSETELVLFPEVGSQIEIAERLRPQYVVCWIGNNDALGAATAFDQLDASQLTPVAEFTADFTQLVERLDALGTKAVFGTIPDITGIGFLLSQNDLDRFLGSHDGLAPGHLTSVPAMLLVKLGLANGSLFSDPSFVLDPGEQTIISNHIDALNAVIRSTVTAHHMALVDTHAVFKYLSAQPPNLFGITLTTRFLGGLFSLDGVHPSNVGHALTASLFIDALNQHYGAAIPQIDVLTAFWLTLTDPFIDKDGDGRVTGRFGQGLLETIFAFLGFSGDPNDLSPSFAATASETASGSALSTSSTSAAVTTRALDEYRRRTGRDLRTMSRDERMKAFRRLFGTTRSAN